MTKRLLKTFILFICLTIVMPMISAFADTTAPDIIGESAITMDLDTGEIIYSKNADVKRSPASTTKLLTALIFAENKTKSDMIPYTDYSASLLETSLAGFVSGTTSAAKAGDTLSADDVMKAVMIYSANDAAVMMAESVSGSIAAFADKMNEKAKELGAVNSHFVNPNGLEESNNVHNTTTAYDLALISKAAYENQWVRDTMAMSKASVNLNGLRIDFDNRNKILDQNGNVGGKTGTETLAGHCFVGFYNRNGRNLVTVVLGSEYGATGMNVFNDTKAIADYSYTATKVPFKSANEEVAQTELSYKLFGFFGPTKTITAPVILNQDVEYYKNDYNDATANIQFVNSDESAWKVAKNNEVGLTFTVGNHTETVQGTIKIKTGDLIKANLPIYLATILVVIIVLILIFLLVKLINKSKRRRNRYYR